MSKGDPGQEQPPSRLIDAEIKALGGWRGETYKDKVKLTFAKGASLKDPSALFNASLDGNVRRAIDIHEGDAINENSLKALIRAAAALNQSK